MTNFVGLQRISAAILGVGLAVGIVHGGDVWPGLEFLGEGVNVVFGRLGGAIVEADDAVVVGPPDGAKGR